MKGIVSQANSTYPTILDRDIQSKSSLIDASMMCVHTYSKKYLSQQVGY